MKKLLISLCFVFALVVSAFAASSVEITGIEVSGSEVEVSFALGNAEQGDEIALVAYSPKNAGELPNAQNIIYLDQADASSGKYSFSMPSDADGEYLLRMGASGVSTADEERFTVEKAPSAYVIAYSEKENGEKINGNISGISEDVWTQLSAGSKLSLSAGEVSGMRFKYWKNAGNGVVISEKALLSYTVGSNASLVAVYETLPLEGYASVGFFDRSGALIEASQVAFGTRVGDIAPTAPDVTGFTFDRWSVADDFVITEDIRILACYTPKYTELGISVNGESAFYSFNDEVSVPLADSVKDGVPFSRWTRDGETVSFDAAYTFFAWADGARIDAVYSDVFVAKRPSIVLDAATVDGAYMMEYDLPEGFVKIEAGLLFGFSDDLSLINWVSKATSNAPQSMAHGQFTARPASNETHACAYLIYKDSGGVKVIYSLTR